MIQYQTFKRIDGVMSVFGRRTASVSDAIDRAAAVKGEVRIWGTLTVVYTSDVFLPWQEPMKPAPVKPTLVRLVERPQLAVPAPSWACNVQRPARRKV